MPSTPITDLHDVARVVIGYTVASPAYKASISNGLWINGCSGKSPSQVWTDIATVFNAFLGASSADGVRSLLPDETTITSVEISKPLLAEQPVPHVEPKNLVGAAGGLMPPETSLVVSLRSDTAGPAFRGRSYHGGLRSTIFDTLGQVVAGNVSTAQTAWNTLRTQLPGLASPKSMIVVSRFTVIDGVLTQRPTPLQALVQSCTIDLHSDTQRRRGVR